MKGQINLILADIWSHSSNYVACINLSPQKGQST